MKKTLFLLTLLTSVPVAYGSQFNTTIIAGPDGKQPNVIIGNNGYMIVAPTNTYTDTTDKTTSTRNNDPNVINRGEIVIIRDGENIQIGSGIIKYFENGTFKKSIYTTQYTGVKATSPSVRIHSSMLSQYNELYKSCYDLEISENYLGARELDGSTIELHTEYNNDGEIVASCVTTGSISELIMRKNGTFYVPSEMKSDAMFYVLEKAIDKFKNIQGMTPLTD